MKKILKKVFSILLIITLLFPLTTYAAKTTYGQFLDDLEKAEKELKQNNNNIENKQNQIDLNNETITTLKLEIEQMGIETDNLQQEIAESEIEIDNKKEQTKNVIAYLQKSQGKNIYLDYVFGAESITDLIYRTTVVDQITEHNNKIISDLESLIKKNEKKKIELAEKQKRYEEKIVSLNNEIKKLNSSITALGSLAPSLEQEVKDKKKLVDYYKEQGCKKRTDVIGVDCAVTSSNGIFFRPTKVGYVTSFVGYRWGELHQGIDIGSPYGRNTELYSIGNGVITKIWSDYYGAKSVNVQYKTNDGKYYTAIYGHLSKYASGIYVGMKVTPDTVLGYMGDTGYAFGVHLHLEVWPCRYGVDSECSTWNKYVNFVNQQFKKGFKGAESVIEFPSRTYIKWTSK